MHLDLSGVTQSVLISAGAAHLRTNHRRLRCYPLRRLHAFFIKAVRVRDESASRMTVTGNQELEGTPRDRYAFKSAISALTY